MSNNYHNHHQNHQHFKHDSAEYEEGVLTVTSSGNVKIALDFTPDEVWVDFIDADPNQHCCDISSIDLVEISAKNTTLTISWVIKATRKLKWFAKTLRK